MKVETLLSGISLHALINSWVEVIELLGTPLTLEVSSGWVVAGLAGLWIWLDRRQR